MPVFFWKCFGIYLLIVNLTGFLLMGLDKRRAKRDRWRIPERTLFLPAVLFGGLGSFLGMRLFRHKTRHWYFRFGFPLLALLELALILFVLIRFGIT